MQFKFDWDEKKNKINRKKHGVWFEEATSSFEDSRARVFMDLIHSVDEDRFVLLGRSSVGRVLVVIHCVRGEGSVVRLISARRATRSEVQFYEKGI